MPVFDCFIIWGHGIQISDKILHMIEDSFEILTVVRKDFISIEKLIGQIYVQEMQTIPHHIIAKNKHLMSFAPEAILVLVKNNREDESLSCNGHGPFNAICTNYRNHFKQVVRDIYNPKQPNGIRTEDHVIHGSDNIEQTDSALKAFGLKPIYEWAVDDCLNWTPEDFFKNHKLGQQAPQDEQLIVREENLGLLQEAFQKTGIQFWLQGKTLLGIYRHNQLVTPDHDDDVGVYVIHRNKISTQLYPQLKEHGFRAIRNDRWFLSVIRKNRYMDICFFEEQQDKTGYGGKWFPKKYFDKFDPLIFQNRFYPVPYKTDELLTYMYPPKPELKPKKKNKARNGLKPLDYRDFLNCLIESDNSINWSLRGPHLNLITENGKRRKISDIVEYFSKIDRIKAIKKNTLLETNTSNTFDEPINLNKLFWQSGNNFFFNCILYGFKKKVVQYSEANRYIKSHNGNGPKLYTNEYYEALDTMNHDEIKQFLRNNPIVIENGAITHGQHRACAMIGVLAAGNEYIPLYVN